jgi:glycosyltransferase involved in cell wall biosynthesis
MYLAGPGDVIGTYRHWREGRHDPSQVAVTYSGQFFDVCRRLGASSYAISYHRRRGRIVDGPFTVEHRPVPLQSQRGPLFHLGWYLYGMSVACSAVWHRCDVLVLMTGTHLVPYWIARCFGVKVVLTQQCVIWPKNLGQRGLWKVVHWLDRGFFRRGANAIISMSHDITAQIDELTNQRHAPIVDFRPHYRRHDFAHIPPSDPTNRPFRVLFAGRVEANKGVFDLIAMASAFQRSRSGLIAFDVAGDGSALAEMRGHVEQQGLQSTVRLHGYCNSSKMQELLASCHIVIVPTKSEMIEGFNKVVAEAVLAHRPFVTSHLCPAIEYVRGGGLEVPADDVDQYVDAIKSLADNRERYEECVDASCELAEQFLDPDLSWAAVLERVLDNILNLNDGTRNQRPADNEHRISPHNESARHATSRPVATVK